MDKEHAKLTITVTNHLIPGNQSLENAQTIGFSGEGCMTCLKEGMIRLLQTNPRFKEIIKEVVHEANLRKQKEQN